MCFLKFVNISVNIFSTSFFSYFLFGNIFTYKVCGGLFKPKFSLSVNIYLDMFSILQTYIKHSRNHRKVTFTTEMYCINNCPHSILSVWKLRLESIPISLGVILLSTFRIQSPVGS